LHIIGENDKKFIIYQFDRRFFMNSIISNGAIGYFLEQKTLSYAVALTLSNEINELVSEAFTKYHPGNDPTTQREKTFVAQVAGLAISSILLEKIGLVKVTLTPASCWMAAIALGIYSYLPNENDKKSSNVTTFLKDPLHRNILKNASFGVLNACAFGWNPLALAIISVSQGLLLHYSDRLKTIETTLGKKNGIVENSFIGAFLGASLFNKHLLGVALGVSVVAVDYLSNR
jgi:hypothetical protein